MKIHIIGAAGSGKTTLATQLGQQFACPSYDLDHVAYENGVGGKRDAQTRAQDVAQIVAHPAWITEGVYLWWVEPLWKSADHIIWLDLPAYVNIQRIVTRHIRLSVKGKNPHAGLRNLWQFLEWQWKTYYQAGLHLPKSADDDDLVSYANTVHALIPYHDKLLRLRSPRAVRHVIPHTFPQETA